jgi:hypothetical protein
VLKRRNGFTKLKFLQSPEKNGAQKQELLATKFPFCIVVSIRPMGDRVLCRLCRYPVLPRLIGQKSGFTPYGNSLVCDRRYQVEDPDPH